jgi:diaminohydroxyphosphoribosylaminopyrimidine deaminase/5-amino-6-(5-phosphoribosylamino)uracil reductase
MERAGQLAGSHHTHPNPRVGAVILDAAGSIVGEGSHRGPGSRHAEIEALAAAGPASEGATMVVTLEPCVHYGLTPPCTDAIVAAGIARVVVGAVDPDERVGGGGIAALRRAGIAVEVDPDANRWEAIDPDYFHHRRTGRSRFMLKQAATLDGQTAALMGSSRWITGERARADAHRLRSEADAVLIGAGTLLSDDPGLDVRLPNWNGPQPRPVVVAGRRPLPIEAKIWDRSALVVATSEPPIPVDTLLVPPGPDGLPDVGEMSRLLPSLGILGVLVEGGATIVSSLFKAGLIDSGVLYLGGKLATGIGKGLFAVPWFTLEDAIDVDITDVKMLGPDLRVSWTRST